jgi:pimeloyl-ACP methyl ester carboxylesterase
MSASPLVVEHYNQNRLWAEDVKAVIDTFRLQRPILSGWSYGGLVIADYIRLYGTDEIGGVNFVGATPVLNELVLGTFAKKHCSWVFQHASRLSSQPFNRAPSFRCPLRPMKYKRMALRI